MKETSQSTSKEKQRYERLASKALRKMSAYLKEPSEEARASLRELFAEVRGVQNEYEHQRWVTVRLIKSRELLIVGIALECILHPLASSDLGYRIARQYAERYNSRFGTGLIPLSRPRRSKTSQSFGGGISLAEVGESDWRSRA
jgi:hypothetical protein